MYQDLLAGTFERLTPAEGFEEQKLFLEHVDSEGTVLRSNHASNYMVLAGTLNRDREDMIDQLARAISLCKKSPVDGQRL